MIPAVTFIYHLLRSVNNLSSIIFRVCNGGKRDENFCDEELVGHKPSCALQKNLLIDLMLSLRQYK